MKIRQSLQKIKCRWQDKVMSLALVIFIWVISVWLVANVLEAIRSGRLLICNN
ncbi:hypothetical protein SPFL3102_01500 [Sporomusaceae bacterium FL31]|nr:hypothetical protein SPFL3101_03133 [Sporomusaceae bacterium FL31]GCE33692.1 hypothetical protein SPFL3102_01500 [Sporomusaceae bacterium]